MKKIPAEAEKAKARYYEKEKEAEEAKEAVLRNEVAMRNLELQIGTRRETIARLKTQQFETRKNDEYAALGHEVERYTREVAKLEDEQLALMEKAEELKAALEAANRAREETKAEVNAELTKLKERHGHVTAQIKDFEAQRAEQAAKIEPALLDRYERLAAAKGDVVVELHGQVCAGCNMKVTAATVSVARAEKEFAFCPNCGRVVYIAHFDD